MIDVIPAILTNSPSELEKKVRTLETFAKRIQVDFCDGEFVSSQTVPTDAVQAVKAAIPIEAHLMVARPMTWIEHVSRIPVDRIIIHVEAVEKPDDIIREIRLHGRDIGLALRPKTPIDRVEPYLEDIDLVQFMTIEPGAQGQPFQPQVLPAIRLLRERNAEIRIQVDGGISATTILQVAEAGADSVIVGSALFAAGLPPSDTYTMLTGLCNTYELTHQGGHP